MINKLTLKHKLRYAFVGVALIPLIISGIYGIYVAIYTTENNLYKNVTQQTILRTEHIKNELNTGKTEISYLSNLPSIKALVKDLKNKESIRAVENDFLNLALNKDFYFQIRFIDPHGMELVRVERGNNQLSFINHNLQFKGDRDYYLKALKLKPGQIDISDLELNQEYGKLQVPYTPVIRFSAPVFRDNKLSGIVVANIYADKLLQANQQDKTENRITVFMIDQNGYFLYHPNEEYRWGSPNNLNTKINIQKRYPELAQTILEAEGEKGKITNGDTIAAFQRINPYQDKNKFWILTVSMPQQSAWDGGFIFGYISLLLGILAILLAHYIAKYFSNKISSPIFTLIQGTDTVAAGNLDHLVQVNSQDELQELAEKFNIMTKKLKDSYLHLEDKIKERTVELEASNAKLAKAYRAKAEFLASMSHEIRTPLNAIIGFAELLQEKEFGLLNTQQKRYLDNIYQSAELLLNIINDFLDLSKIEAGKMTLNYKQLTISKLINDIITIMQPLADKKDIKLLTEVNADLVVLADEQRLKQVLLNLISNSIKFTNQTGWVKITVKGNPDHWVLIVEDNGIGIDPQAQQDVFEEFVQLNNTQEGTGLGLALVKRLAELHGGLVTLHSIPGHGTTIILSFQK